MTTVPQAWTDAMGHFRAAQVARDQMRDPEANQQARDIACARYTQSVDALMDSLGRCSEVQLLGNITLMLARKDVRR
jgi:hypothetical protein